MNFSPMVKNARTKVAKKDTSRLVNTGLRMGVIEKKDVLTSTRKPMSQENITKKCTEVEAEVLQEVTEEACTMKGV